MIIIAIRTAIIYLAALAIIRIMGKGEMSSMDPFQMVVLFMIAELAALSIEAPDISVLTGLTALVTLLFLQVLFSFISMKSPRFRNLINGKPIILVEKGKVNEKEMERLRISIDDLSQQLRLKNAPSPSDVDYAVMEVNGDLSVIMNPAQQPATRTDVRAKTAAETIPLVLIANGHIYGSNLAKLGKTEQELKNALLQQDIRDFKDVYLCFSDEQGNLVVHEKTAATAEGWEIQ